MKDFIDNVKKQFDKMSKTGHLFRVEISGDELYEIYLGNLENDPVFRDPNSTVHNCNLCKNFFRRYGNIVSIDENYNLVSMFDNDDSEEYKNVSIRLSEAIKNSKIQNVFFESYNDLDRNLNYERVNKSMTKFKLGIESNFKTYTREDAEKYKNPDGSYIVKEGEVRKFDHLNVVLPSKFVHQGADSLSSVLAEYSTTFQLYNRGLKEISIESLELIIELFEQDSLLNSKSYLNIVKEFLKEKKTFEAFASLNQDKKENFIWNQVSKGKGLHRWPVYKFKNTLVGEAAYMISESLNPNSTQDTMTLDSICEFFNKQADPSNYKKAKSPITKRQIEEAKKFLQAEGYEDSFDRRYATIEDIEIEQIMHINSTGEIKPVSILDSVKSDVANKAIDFKGIPEMSIEKFMSDILPKCTSVELYLENKMEKNLCTILTSNKKDSKRIFKYDNNFSKTFKGNLAGFSMIKEAVKARGGNIDGFLNIRLHFPNTTSDYDLHVLEPNGGHVHYAARNSANGGKLDLDAQGGDGDFPPDLRVENVTYKTLNQLSSGEYKVFVNNFSNRDNKFGFIVEIEFEGQTFLFEYNKFIKTGENVSVCKIIVSGDNKKGKTVTIKEILPISKSSSRSLNMWGLNSNEFHKVKLVCLSPNYWGDVKIGALYYMFMLEGCKTDERIRSFHNEDIKEDLMKHRKFIEALGSSVMLEPADNQVSGVGFNASVRDSFIVKVEGKLKQIIKINV